jgi:transposase
MERPVQKLNDLSRSLIALEPAGTLTAVIEMSLSSWLVAGIVPGVERQPLKKLAVDESVPLSPLPPAIDVAASAMRRIERIEPTACQQSNPADRGGPSKTF